MKAINNELQLQSFCWQKAWNEYPFLRYRIFQVHNNTSNVIQAMQKKASGLVAGVPDMCCLLPNKNVVWIEFKFMKNKKSEAQIKLHENWKSINHNIFTVNSVELFDQIIKEFVIPHYKELE